MEACERCTPSATAQKSRLGGWETIRLKNKFGGRKKMRAIGRSYTPGGSRVIRFLLVLLQIFLIPGLIWAADPGSNNCPLTTHRYKAQLRQAHLTGKVGEKIILSFSVKPPELPPGFFLSVNMNALKVPDAAKSKRPEILTGFPETSAVFRAPGIYRYMVLVSLLTKTSCGGVEGDTILKDKVRIDIKP
jgi:hypothetical protein